MSSATWTKLSSQRSLGRGEGGVRGQYSNRCCPSKEQGRAGTKRGGGQAAVRPQLPHGVCLAIGCGLWQSKR